nr:hypothetical protein [Tanacetum cinerariifolium]
MELLKNYSSLNFAGSNLLLSWYLNFLRIYRLL